jgi:hypothetical protein
MVAGILSLTACGGTGRAPDEPPSSALVGVKGLGEPGSRARASLSPALAAVLPTVALPRGSRLTLARTGWRESGRFARATGSLSVPGEQVHPVTVGFMKIGSQWKITFVEPTS